MVSKMMLMLQMLDARAIRLSSISLRFHPLLSRANEVLSEKSRGCRLGNGNLVRRSGREKKKTNKVKVHSEE